MSLYSIEQSADIYALHAYLLVHQARINTSIQGAADAAATGQFERAYPCTFIPGNVKLL